MSSLPDLDTLLRKANLPAGSHLTRVVEAEAARAATMPKRATAPRTLHTRFAQALRAAQARDGGAVIAEFKRGSPSLGPFAANVDRHTQLQRYVEGGAACFSVLAEPALFLGSPKDVLESGTFCVPRLYKGFVLGEAHLAEAAQTGADAVLLIARILREYTAAFADAARALGLEPLIELHDASEIAFAKPAHAELIGINARDLASFAISTPSAAPLREAFPNAVLIRESGLHTPRAARDAFALGFDAVLIGEALMRSHDPAGFLREIRGA